MDLKEKSSAALKEHRTTVKEGAGKSLGQLIGWVMAPGSAKDSCVRAAGVLAAVVMWFMCARSSPLLTLAVTPVALLGVFLWSGMKKEEAPAEVSGEPSSGAGEEPSGGDEFWDKHTPRSGSPVSLEKEDSDTESDEDSPDTPTVRIRPKVEEGPNEEENLQVSGLPDTRTAHRTPESDGLVTGNDSHVDHVGIFPVITRQPEDPVIVSEPQVSGVSGLPDTGHRQTAPSITESETSPGEDEEPPGDFAARILKLSDKGASVREIAEATGRKRSTVQDMLKKAREERIREEMTAAAVRARRTENGLSGTPVSQVVLPGAWYGEDGHAQEVRFTGDAVSLSGERTQEEAVSVMEFIRMAFLGKAEMTTENWALSLEGGVISGSVPGRQAGFQGFWSETGTVVISRVSLQ